MSKLNVGVGAEFPVNDADARPSDDERFEGCDYRQMRRDYREARRDYRRRFGRRHGWHGGRFFGVGAIALIVFIALISLAVSYPMVILGLMAIAAFAFAARRHHHHDWHDHDDRYERDDYNRRDRGYDQRQPDVGPQPDAPSGPSQARS